MADINLDRLLYSIQDAVNNSNESVRQQYFKDLNEYFDDKGKPVMIDMDMPYVSDQGTEFQKFQIPKLSLIPLTTMKVKEVDIDFKVALSELPLQSQEEDTIQESDTKHGSPQEKTVYSQKQKKPDLQVNFNPTSKNTDDLAHIHIRMEGSEPPEGVIKINDHFMKYLP